MVILQKTKHNKIMMSSTCSANETTVTLDQVFKRINYDEI